MSFSLPPFSRRRMLQIMGAGVAGCLVDGFVIEPGSLSVTREDVACEKLPPGLDGLRIGMLGDFHFRPDDDPKLLEKVCAAVTSESLDLVALVGDYINHDASVIAPLLGHLEKLKARHGIFAVMGNHDGWSGDRSRIKRQFEKAGISFFINQHRVIEIRGDRLAIAGTDFVWLGAPDPARTLRGIPSDTPVLALVHEPDYFDVMTAQREIALQLSGHTHGGQCRVPVAGIAPMKVKYGQKYLHGQYQHGNSRLFVTRGVGTTGLRVRFACPPELVVLTLRAASVGEKS
jgi:predicted MPP superfamily phosphohydrolase